MSNSQRVAIITGASQGTDEDYDAMTGVNLRGFFEVSGAAVAAMLSPEGGGHIGNISTSLVDHPQS
jgi:NAD(P)-dependent dehydrogenase (short-subunit alcohol dehydrogenase family)